MAPNNHRTTVNRYIEAAQDFLDALSHLGFKIVPCYNKNPSPYSFRNASDNTGDFDWTKLKTSTEDPQTGELSYHTTQANGYLYNIPQGFVVLDLDDPSKADFTDFPKTATFQTSPGRYHLIYQGDIAEDVKRSLKSATLTGVEVFGANSRGMVGPGSEHPEHGHSYQAISDYMEFNSTQAIDWSLLTHPSTTNQDAWHDRTQTDDIQQGSRTNALIALIGSLRRRGYSTPYIEARVRLENKLLCDPPISEGKLKAQVLAALKRDWTSEAIETLDLTTCHHCGDKPRYGGPWLRTPRARS